MKRGIKMKILAKQVLIRGFLLLDEVTVLILHFAASLRFALSLCCISVINLFKRLARFTALNLNNQTWLLLKSARSKTL